MTDFLNVVKDVYVYWLVYAFCFLMSITYIRAYWECIIEQAGIQHRKDIYEYNELVHKYNELTDKYNDLGDEYNNLFDKYDELRGWYAKAYEKYDHVLIVEQTFGRKSIVTFTQVFYPQTNKMMCISLRLNRDGNTRGFKFGDGADFNEIS